MFIVRADTRYMEEHMPIRMQIGELARQQGLTIKALAERAGVAYNTAHALYTGRALRIDLDTLDRVCVALQVEPGEVFIRTAPDLAEREPDRASGYGADAQRTPGAHNQRTADPL